MEEKSNVSVDDEVKYPDIFSRNSRITEILDLVLNQPRTEEMKNILLDFWNKYDNILQEVDMHMDVEDRHEYNLMEDNLEEANVEDVNLEKDNMEEDNPEDDNQEEEFLEFDVLCMFMLDYVFKRNGPMLSAVSRSLYCYVKCLNLSVKNRNDIMNGTENDFVNALRAFTNFSSSEGEDILIDALIKSLLDGKFGLSVFLLKFGIVEIPTEANEKSRKIVEKLVDRFNDILYYTIGNGQAEDMQASINPDELLDLMRRSNINFRRSLITFFLIVIISEFRLHEKIENNYLKDRMNFIFFRKLVCIYEVLDATTEAKLKFQDIEIFIVKCLNPLLNADFGKSLAQFSRHIHCHFFDTLQPRSLKDLARSTIRENLQNSMTFPEQVNRFDIPYDLKGFLIYHCEGLFDVLEGSHHTSNFEDTIKLLLDENAPIYLEI